MTDLPLDSVVYLECILVDKASSAFPGDAVVRPLGARPGFEQFIHVDPSRLHARRLRTWLGYSWQTWALAIGTVGLMCLAFVVGSRLIH